MSRRYHHGDLPAALLRAAADILRNEGLPALTLRAVARRVGVSHMAPTPHFGDLSGLLSELAAVGHRMFNEALLHAQENPGTRSIPHATAQAYVGFARAEPAMFLLMFRAERLDVTRPSLAQAIAESSRLLMRSVDPEESRTGKAGELGILGQAVGRWSIVHGFAMLLIDKRLDSLLSMPVCHGDVEALLDAVLTS